MPDGSSKAPLDYAVATHRPPMLLSVAALICSCCGCPLSFAIAFGLVITMRRLPGIEFALTFLPELFSSVLSIWLYQLHGEAGLSLTAPKFYLGASLGSLVVWSIFLALIPRYAV